MIQKLIKFNFWKDANGAKSFSLDRVCCDSVKHDLDITDEDAFREGSEWDNDARLQLLVYFSFSLTNYYKFIKWFILLHKYFFRVVECHL